MCCWKCGAPNDDKARKCVQCDAYLRREAPARRRRHGATPGHAYQRGRRIPNYLAHAILCTIFCCLPFGIVAIVYAAQVDGKAATGDIRGARFASNKAQSWCEIAFYIGIAVQILNLVVGGIMLL